MTSVLDVCDNAKSIIHSDRDSIRLRNFLEANEAQIIGFVERSQRQFPIDGMVYPKLMTELFSLFRITKDGFVPVLDKSHTELAIAICEALWCGWFSQTKMNEGAIEDCTERFKQAITSAFEIGQEYASKRSSHE